jgi:hypothetical protein
MRLVESGDRTLALASAELVAYIAVTVAATLRFERPLIREVLEYLRRSKSASAEAFPAGP